jgi:hypothetical protein
METMNLYRAIDVWKRVDRTTAVRYRCFESLQSKRYCVQSADFYRLPLDQKQDSNLDSQFVQLFIEQEPSSRTAECLTLDEAIAAHDKDFL